MDIIIYCSVCGINSTQTKVFSANNKFKIVLCNKHYMQMYHTGRTSLKFKKSPNEIILLNDHAEIVLYDRQNNTKQERVLIDLEDINIVQNKKISITNEGYAIIKKDTLLHRFIMKLDSQSEMVVDHINHNKLDNRKSNLRIVTYSQNNMNQINERGISWNKRDKCWHTYINMNNKRINIGYFKNYDDAKKAREIAEIKYYGEYRYKEGKINE